MAIDLIAASQCCVLQLETKLALASTSVALDAARTAAGGWSMMYARDNPPPNSSCTGSLGRRTCRRHRSGSRGGFQFSRATWKPRT